MERLLAVARATRELESACLTANFLTAAYKVRNRMREAYQCALVSSSQGETAMRDEVKQRDRNANCVPHSGSVVNRTLVVCRGTGCPWFAADFGANLGSLATDH